ncbi:Uma2 family endonuclease [Lentzea sp.]|uniref:Uma2 family endonuclease n=1 Tax=Lentzea sp. TaxID=56099 RepID=UPI002C105DED|nr:Uma2 family endonuclease [Lentzea sp.]HUQ58309.1 Uma2 family endonuclease [Lentzea sp.]
MTTLPDRPSRRLPAVPAGLLTVAQYAALGETEDGFTELVEGRLIMTPSPSPRHNVILGELLAQLRDQVPNGHRVIPDIDIDLQLAPVDQPGFVRRPDLAVVRQAEIDRVDREGGLLRASEVLLVVEILSPSSKRTDHRAKRDEYCAAGIPFYWIIEPTRSVSLAAMHLAGESGYQEAPAEFAVYEATEPFPVKIAVSQLC